MPTHLDGVVRRLREATLPQATDPHLLRRFVESGDGAAFEALVRRHGGMVLAVSRRVLRNAADAEDCFQATFLVLVRKARSIRRPECLANWLYGVAYRVANKVRVAAARRRVKEAHVTPRTETPNESDDLLAVLDEELIGLPDTYRAAVVLCDLEGKSRKEAAQLLGCAEGTVASRLSRGRQLLACRLARRGFAVTAGALACVLSREVFAAPPSLVKAAGILGASAKVLALTEGMLKMMLLSKLKALAGVALLLGVLVTAPGLTGGGRAPAGEAPRPQKQTKAAATVSDAEFIRRACLDLRGSLPSDIEVHYFLLDHNPQKRAWLVEKLKEEAARAAKPAREDPQAGDAAKLQGTWVVESVEHSGTAVPADTVKDWNLVFRGDRVSSYREGKLLGETRFTLDTKRKPPVMRVTASSGPNPGPHETFIYDLRGDRLRLCANSQVNGPLPTAFGTRPGKAGAGNILLELRRVGESEKQ
jgi:RNA polymerase sigma factor (sigma-70 family)